MDIDTVIAGTEAHYHMICSKCPYHKEATRDNDEYCGRGELYRDTIAVLNTLKEIESGLQKISSGKN